MNRTIRTLSVGAAAALTSALAVVAVAPSASAEVSLAQCAGSQRSTFDPAVTNTPTLVFAHAQASYTCVLPLLESVTRSQSGTGTLSCESLLEPLPGADTLHWGNGGTSDYTYTTSLTAVNGITVATNTGTITSGRYVGATVVETMTLGSLDLGACSGDGIAAADYVNTLTITGL
jgi:hypothetical protein